MKCICFGLLAVTFWAAGLLAGESAAPANIIANPGFEEQGDGAVLRWKVGGDPTQCKIIEENGNHFLRVQHDQPATSVIEQRFPVDPKWAILQIKVRQRAKNLKPGPEGWNTMCVQYVFEDAQGKHLGGWPKRNVAQDQDWTVDSEEIAPEPGAAMLAVQCCVFNCTGTFDFDDITVIPQTAGAVPMGIQLAGDEPVEAQGTKRGRIVLNGVWKFMPALGAAESQPTEDWGYIRVPGTWNGIGNLPGYVLIKKTGPWANLNREQLGKAWYERPLKVPAEWAGRAILVDLRRVSTDAVVYVDGKECGKVNWPYGEVDITSAVKPGQEQTLRVFVLAVQDQAKVLNAMGVGQNTLVDAKLESRGLIGEVFLVSRPAKTFVSDVFVRTSTRKKELALDVELTGLAQAGRVNFTARVLDADGKEAKRFESAVEAKADAVQTVTLAWPWADPKLWDLGQPNLYTLQLQAQADGLDDVYVQEFGFRECWIEGRNVYLNGTLFRLRPTSSFNEGTWGSNNGMLEGIDGSFKGLVYAGFNILELWPGDQTTRGSFTFRELICERGSKLGFPIMGPSLSASSVVGWWASGKWDKPDVRADWERRMERDLRRYRNYPSILIWTHSGNISGHEDDQDPRRLGRSVADPVWSRESGGWKKSIEQLTEVTELLRKHDPTRPSMIHQGGPLSNIYAVNNYLCMIPLQEREEWLSDWAQTGDMPYCAVEFGTPLHVTMNRGRCGFGPSQASEPWMTEFCAIYFGNEAFQSEEPVYRAAIKAKLQKDQTYSGWQNNPTLDHAAAFQRLGELFVTNTWESWRTMGITAGMVPWSDAQGWKSQRKQIAMPPFTPGRRGAYYPRLSEDAVFHFQPEATTVLPAGKALMTVNAATLAWIAGAAATEKDIAAFTSKDHHYRPGETVRKQIALLNDTRTPQEYAFACSASVGGKELPKVERRGTLAVGETKFEPVEFALPAQVDGKTDGVVRLSATIGAAQHAREFSFRVFPAEPAAKGDAVAIFDPVGETTALLKALGVETKAWDGAAVPVLVIGRKALGPDRKAPGDLEAFVRNGGRLLVMAQDPQWMSGYLGLRVCAHLTRRVFPIDAKHPVVSGLDAEDLRDWNGFSTLIEPKPEYSKQSVRGAGSPCWGWRWGSRGAVSSAAIEKPHYGGWRPLLECEFDLAYSPLLERDLGKGRAVLCTLDLEDHVSVDPAAERMARNLLRYATTAPLAPVREGKTLYLGGEAGAKLLSSLGLKYEKAAAPEATAALIVVGPDRSVEDLSDYVQNGGRVFVLAHRETAPGLGVTIARKDAFHGSLQPPTWPEARGLSASDLRWRTDGTAWLANGGEVGADGLLARVAQGKGVAIFCQLDPDALEADTKTYFRFTRWRQTRVMGQLLANLGGAFAADARIFHPEDPMEDRFALAGTWKAKLTDKKPAAGGPGQLKDAGITPDAQAAVAADFDDSTWEDAAVPGMWAPLSDADGEAVFRKTIELPERLAGKDLLLCLGSVDDFDITFVNGTRVGGIGPENPNAWNTKREYTVPAKLLKPGKNVIAVRLFDHFGGGGFGGQPQVMELQVKNPDAKVVLYHPDYRQDFDFGDDPYRYYRW